MEIDTAKVTGRRNVSYSSFTELLADAERLNTGPIQQLGNWTPGQIYRHLALTLNGSVDGLKIVFPWYLRLGARLFKPWILKGSMPAGVKLPARGGEVLEPGTVSNSEGLAQLKAAVARLQQTPQRAIHPVFGKVTREEWDTIHLGHAALHMSFLVPE